MIEEQELDLGKLEHALGYQFKDRSVLVRALTHRSYANESKTGEDNQRLEYLGDAVLDLVISTELYKRFRREGEGRLSYVRSRLVREEALAAQARQLDLGAYLLLGKGEAMSGGREKESLLADAYEAVIAAVYLDGGFDAIYQVIVAAFHETIDVVTTTAHSGDYKTRLQELVQAQKDARPKYAITAVDGPPHARLYTASVTIDGAMMGVGQGASKKAAHQSAAKAALERLGAKS